jgi:hypothetical protein
MTIFNLAQRDCKANRGIFTSSLRTLWPDLGCDSEGVSWKGKNKLISAPQRIKYHPLPFPFINSLISKTAMDSSPMLLKKVLSMLRIKHRSSWSVGSNWRVGSVVAPINSTALPQCILCLNPPHFIKSVPSNLPYQLLLHWMKDSV